jgi:uncharacterized repeat protein (TIGR01451 family)
MFEKFLSLVPYNPGMLHQLAFYGRRMREEASIRRLGMGFIVLAFIVQSVAVIHPPASAAVCKPNSMIECGFNSISEARQACISDKQGYMQFLHYYGISCSAFDTATEKTIHTNGQNYFSVGRDLSPTRDHPVSNIPENGTVYWRDLSVWGGQSCTDGSGGHDCWKTMSLKDQDGKTFYIIFDCGNLVSVGIPPKNQLVTESATPFTPSTTPAPIPAPTPVAVPGPTPAAPTPTPPAPCPYNSQIPASSPMCFKPCPYNGSIPDTDTACKPCDKSSSQTDSAACVSVRKTATNLTQNIIDANNTTANAGDVITYTLYAQNTGKAVIQDFVFQENLSDVLDYADLADAHGGTLVASDGVIAWPARNLAPNETASVQVSVKVKNPIPQTPAAANDPSGFDMIMTNVYGNAINIKLPPSPAKQVETVAATLPNTGPGTTLFVGAAIVILAGYFYSRANLLARESDIAVKESA